MRDIRELYHLKAEELAGEKYAMKFYYLPKYTQIVIYSMAKEIVKDEFINRADSLRKET